MPQMYYYKGSYIDAKAFRKIKEKEAKNTESNTTSPDNNKEETLWEKYKRVLGKNVPNRFKNDIAWIEARIKEATA